ncbi:hypothetical protein SAMN06265348_101311 [Pedobacter westerhofensis]|uniref:Uncharacterized protein n=1 Tax=Pedobacter westerhofensis TaxID=425512 RepID=A0A521AMS4_9SPHI|nr:hypothetical protein SAMN06265348_101311 [Pedobacter westerhofensis]
MLYLIYIWHFWESYTHGVAFIILNEYPNFQVFGARALIRSCHASPSFFISIPAAER